MKNGDIFYDFEIDELYICESIKGEFVAKTAMSRDYIMTVPIEDLGMAIWIGNVYNKKD